MYVGSRDARRGQATVEELGDGARLLVLDVTDEHSVANAAAHVEKLDVLVNNAGTTGPPMPVWETYTAQFEEMPRLHLLATFCCVGAVVPALPRGG